MGNEMGNANVSALQEEKNGENETENKSLETPITHGNDNSVIAQKQPESLSQDENCHDYVDSSPSGLENSRGDEETSAIIDSDDNEENAPDGFLNDLLISKDSNDKKKEPLSTRKEETSEEAKVVSDTTPSETGMNVVEDRKEKETTDIEIQLTSNVTAEEGAESVISSDDVSYHEMESASDKILPETSDDKIQRSTNTEREELTSAPEIQLRLLMSEFNAINDQDSDQLKPSLINNEPYVGVVRRSNSDDQVLSTLDHCDDIGKGSEKEKETEHTLDGSACASYNEKSEVENLGNSLQVEEEKSQEETLLQMNQTDDRRLDISAGAVLDIEDVENGEIQFITPYAEEKDSMHSHLEIVPDSASLESLQKENSQAEDKFIVQTNDEDQSKIPKFEQKKNVPNVNSPSQESQEEPKLGKMNTSNVDGEATTNSEVDKYTIRTDLQSTEEKAIGVGHHVAFRDINMSAVREEDTYAGQEPETRDEDSGPQIELWEVDTNSEDVKFPKCSLHLRGSHVEEPVLEKEELQDYLEKDDEETVAPKAVFLNLDPTNLDTSSPLPSVENLTHDPKPIPSAMAVGAPGNWRNTILELAQESYKEIEKCKTSDLHAEVSRIEASTTQKKRSISTDQSQGQENIYPSDPPIGYDLKMNLGSPDSNESYTTAYEQEHLLPNVDAAVGSSFRIEDQVAQTLFVEMIADFNQHAELSREGEAEFSKQTSLKHEEKTISSEMFKASGSELYAQKVGVSSSSPVSEATTLAPEGNKAIPSERPSQEKISEEKQVTTLGRTNSAKLDIHIPLLSYLKDETYYMGSQHKQEKLVSKKTINDKWNTCENKNSGNARQRGEKRKAKPLFFNICMCCTPDIP